MINSFNEWKKFWFVYNHYFNNTSLLTDIGWNDFILNYFFVICYIFVIVCENNNFSIICIQKWFFFLVDEINVKIRRFFCKGKTNYYCENRCNITDIYRILTDKNWRSYLVIWSSNKYWTLGNWVTFPPQAMIMHSLQNFRLD